MKIQSVEVVREHLCECAHHFIAQSEQYENVSPHTRSKPGVCATYSSHAEPQMPDHSNKQQTCLKYTILIIIII